MLAEHDRQDVLLRIMLHEGEHFPELAALIREKIVEPGYRRAADWVRARIADGGFPEYDADAIAVVALGSLLAYSTQGKTFGSAPLGVDVERFIDTWVEAWLRVAADGRARTRERHGVAHGRSSGWAAAWTSTSKRSPPMKMPSSEKST